MTSNPTEFHQLGYFIYLFQSVERQIEEMIILLSDADDEMVSILMNELDFSGKLKAIDVMFARFIDVKQLDSNAKKDFHKEIDKVIALSKRRNELVHSKYRSLLNVAGNIGLLRENSKLKPSKGIRHEDEEELMPEDFGNDLKTVNSSMNNLEAYRLKIIDWMYPVVQA
jgi:hypothetical protein